MFDHLLQPKSYDEVAGTSALKELNLWLHNRDHFRAVHDQLTEVIGPLDVAGRWGLLGNYGLEVVRKHIDLSGSAYNVASAIASACEHYGYPPSALILQLVGDKTDLDNLDVSLKPFLQQLLVPQEK